MTVSPLFWFGLVVYALILFLFLAMTRREQRLNRVPWRKALMGFAACLVWPVTVVVFTVATLRRKASD